MGAGDTVELAAAGADSEIQDGRPQPLQAALQCSGVNDVGWTDSHTLTTFETSGQEVRFSQGARRTNNGGRKVIGTYQTP